MIDFSASSSGTILLIVLSSVLTFFFAEVLPFEWKNLRERSRSQAEDQLDWHREVSFALNDLSDLLYRQMRSSEPDYEHLNTELEDISNQFSRLAEDPRSTNSESISFKLGKISKSCSQLAIICGIYNQYSGSDRILEFMILGERVLDDEEIGEFLQHKEEIPDEYLTSPSVQDRHVDDQQLEETASGTPFAGSRSEFESMSIFDPLLADIFLAIDDSFINRAMDDALMNQMKLLLDACRILKQEVDSQYEGLS